MPQHNIALHHKYGPLTQFYSTAEAWYKGKPLPTVITAKGLNYHSQILHMASSAYSAAPMTSFNRTSEVKIAVGLSAEEAASYLNQVDDKAERICLRHIGQPNAQQLRRCKHLPGLACPSSPCGYVRSVLSVVLPMILGVGVVAENIELVHAFKQKGMYGIDEEALIEAFETAITSSLQEAVNDSAATDIFWVEDPRFSHVVHVVDGAAGQQSILAAIKAATSLAEAVAAVTERFIGKLARKILLEDDEFEADTKSIALYGIDSMIGAELRN
ncbi:hypothetical protein UA08_01432 [Talaromyces atroroseus]|uniref:Carrier domain-containing protein n=1 Tax=Talaromyces atroroseus TaxID=1441469 RepID=A0A1Q5QBA9_TALAT|nr:hypothetical protein UA08_01432 [Talaromyces atroroseus]OKL63225.1 hypothetical protein UA08_01432 [Talaromyces atroroseus]